MACFTLNADERANLAGAIAVGMDGVDENCLEVLGALLEELEASDKPIDITVMPFEDHERIDAHVYDDNGLIQVA